MRQVELVVKNNFVVMWMGVRGGRKKIWAARELILAGGSRDLLGALRPGGGA